MGLNLNPLGGGPLEGWSFTGCAIFAVWGSEITWLASLTGTIYLRLSFFYSVGKGHERSKLLGSILHGLEWTCHFLTLWPYGLKRSQIWFIFPLLVDSPERRHLPVFLWGVLKAVSDFAIWAMVLKESDEWSWKDSDLLLCFLCHGLLSILSRWSCKELLGLVFALFSMAEMDLETFLHNTWMRPNLLISFGVLVSTM